MSVNPILATTEQHVQMPFSRMRAYVRTPSQESTAREVTNAYYVSSRRIFWWLHFVNSTGKIKVDYTIFLMGLGAFPPGHKPPGQIPPTFPQRTYPPLKLSHPVRSPHFNRMAKIKKWMCCVEVNLFVFFFSLVTSAFSRLTVSWVRRYFLAKFNRVGMTDSKGLRDKE